MNEATNDIWMVIQIITVARQRPKNTNTTKITNNMAYMIVSSKLSMVFRMLSEVLTMIPSFTSLGNDFCNCGSISITFCEIATELAPDCFCTTIIAPCTPLLYVFCARSSTESTIFATSRR